MAKDNELVISAEEITIANDRGKVKACLSNIDMIHVIEDMDEDLFDEVLTWIRSNRNPDDVFDEKDLSKWATENGYTKE